MYNIIESNPTQNKYIEVYKERIYQKTEPLKSDLKKILMVQVWACIEQ